MADYKSIGKWWWSNKPFFRWVLHQIIENLKNLNYATLSNCYYFPKWAFFGKTLEFEFDSLDTTAGNMAEE